MSLFVLSLVPLLIGPLLVRLLQSSPRAARLLDAFVLVSVGGLIFTHILPHAIAHGGMSALGATVVGLGLPLFSGKLWHGGRRLGQRTTVVLALLALGIHATIDGAALAGQSHGQAHGSDLALAVVLHRLPVGLAIWWLVRPRLGSPVAMLTVGLVALATTAGYVGAHFTEALLTGVTGSTFQALVAGALIHVVVGHRHGPAQAEPHAGWRPGSAFGALLAVALLVSLSGGDQDPAPGAHTLTAGETFLTLALQCAPLLLLAYLAAGLAHVLLPEHPVRWLSRSAPASQAAAGAVAGLPLSTCSCGIEALYRALVQRGVPASATIALLVAAPELGVASVLLSLQLLGVRLGLSRIAAAVVLAMLMGLWLGKKARRAAHAPELGAPSPSPPRAPLAQKLTRALQHGFGATADHTLPWMLAGLGIAALIEPLLPPAWLAAVPATLGIVLAALLGLPLYVCAAGSTPLAAVLVHKGLAPGAAVTLLLAGAATNVATLRALSRFHGRRLAVHFGAAVVLLALAAGLAVNAAFGSVQVVLHDMVASSRSWIHLVSLALLSALVLVSLFRQGVEGFVAQLRELHGRVGHHHCYEEHDLGQPEHDHEHEHEGGLSRGRAS